MLFFLREFTNSLLVFLDRCTFSVMKKERKSVDRKIKVSQKNKKQILLLDFEEFVFIF